MNIPIYQVDAFSSCLFKGNPAAVCFLREWLSDRMMQNIARENNLSETAFFLEEGNHFHIRWFTPEKEIDLCGHATLATAHVLFNHLFYGNKVIKFLSRTDELIVSRSGPLIALNFPARPAVPIPRPDEVIDAIGLEASETLRGRDYLLIYSSEEEIRAIKPDFQKLAKAAEHGVIVSAPGEKSDFVSRFFAPAVGINEDPVTGSAHTSLIPFWAERFGWNEMTAAQLSERGGELYCEYLGSRVLIKGRAVTFLQGEITI